MYDASALLDRLDTHTIPILLGFAVAMVLQTVWLVTAIRVAARDRLYSIPLFCTFFWFAHDLGCVVRFDQWFHVHDHWFMKFFWVGLLSAFLLEFVFFAQVLKHGRKELAPWMTGQQLLVVIVLGALGGILLWEFVRSVVEDPLYVGTAGPTLASYALLGPALYLRRRSMAGQSTLMWACFTLMTATWWTTSALGFGAGFRSWQYLALGAFAFGVGVVMTTVAAREKRAATGRASQKTVALAV